MIGGNGAYVEDRGRVLLHRKISLNQCRRIVDWLRERGLAFYLESSSGLFASETFEEDGLPAIRAYAGLKGGGAIGSVRDVFPDMIFGAGLYRDDLSKVSFVLSSYQDYLDAAGAFPDFHVGTWGGAGEEALFGDIGLSGISKSGAVRILLDHLGADLSETIAFGDARIDIPMLEYCAFGVAMGSGGEEIRAMADYVTDDVDRDGLYKAFVHLGLI